MDRWEGTVFIGTLLTTRFAPTALSSEGTDCSSEDLQNMVKTYSWVSDTIFKIFYFKQGQWASLNISGPKPLRTECQGEPPLRSKNVTNICNDIVDQELEIGTNLQKLGRHASSRVRSQKSLFLQKYHSYMYCKNHELHPYITSRLGSICYHPVEITY